MKKIYIINIILVCYFLAPAGVFAAEEDSIEKYATEKTPCALWSEKAARSMNEQSESYQSFSLPNCQDICKQKFPNTSFLTLANKAYQDCLDDCKTTKAQENMKTNPYYGKICTDLMEGIPCAALQEGECRENVNCVEGAIGKRNKKGDISPVTQEEEKMCYAVITGSGLQGIEMYIGIIYRYASWFIGIIGVLMIIISGIQISIGGASQESFAQGKKRIMEVIAGLVLFFLIGVILRTINPLFFQ